MKKFDEEPIFITNKIQFQNVLQDYKLIQKIKYKCIICGKIETIQLRSQRVYPEYCIKCSRKKTFQMRYGVDSPGQSVEFKQRAKETCKKKYGVENPFQSDLIKDKIKQTCISRYGVPNPRQNTDIVNKCKQTCIERYGVDNPAKVAEIQNKMQQTCLERYGVKNASQLEEIKQKKRDTLYKHFGSEHPLYHNYIYTYNNIRFDSSWELAFYLYYFLNNIPIEREPVYFEYSFNNITHRYYPDFKVNNTYYEIKGCQFLNEKGELYSPYDPNLNGLYSAKYECMLKNNVILVTKKDMKLYLDFIKDNNISLASFRNNL